MPNDFPPPEMVPAKSGFFYRIGQRSAATRSPRRRPLSGDRDSKPGRRPVGNAFARRMVLLKRPGYGVIPRLGEREWPGRSRTPSLFRGPICDAYQAEPHARKNVSPGFSRITTEKKKLRPFLSTLRIESLRWGARRASPRGPAPFYHFPRKRCFSGRSGAAPSCALLFF